MVVMVSVHLVALDLVPGHLVVLDLVPLVSLVVLVVLGLCP